MLTRSQHYEALAQLEPDHAVAHDLLRKAHHCQYEDSQLGLANETEQPNQRGKEGPKLRPAYSGLDEVPADFEQDFGEESTCPHCGGSLAKPVAAASYMGTDPEGNAERRAKHLADQEARNDELADRELYEVPSSQRANLDGLSPGQRVMHNIRMRRSQEPPLPQY